MRFTTLITLFGLTGAVGCISEVGGDECIGARCPGQGTGSGSASGSGSDDGCEELVQNLTIRTAADFDGLPDTCWTLNGNLRLEGAAITSLAKLGPLTEVNDLEIVDTQLASIDAPKTIQVWGSLLVSGNGKLASLSNLAVERWTGPVAGGAAWTVGYTIRDNAALTSIDALRYIKQVDRDLRITGNTRLGSFGFEELTRISGGLYIANTAATAVRFPSLATVTRIELANNASLSSIAAYAATQIGELVVDNNDALTDLAALVPSQRINGAVTITNNNALTSLGRLAQLPEGVRSTVTITGNPSLVSCRANEVAHCGQVGTTAAVIQNNGSTSCNGCYCGR